MSTTEIKKNAVVSIDINIARSMLRCSGFKVETVENMTDDEVFNEVLDFISCYGAKITIMEN